MMCHGRGVSFLCWFYARIPLILRTVPAAGSGEVHTLPTQANAVDLVEGIPLGWKAKKYQPSRGEYLFGFYFLFIKMCVHLYSIFESEKTRNIPYLQSATI